MQTPSAYLPGQPRIARSATLSNSSRLAPAAARTDRPSSTPGGHGLTQMDITPAAMFIREITKA